MMALWRDGLEASASTLAGGGGAAESGRNRTPQQLTLESNPSRKDAQAEHANQHVKGERRK